MPPLLVYRPGGQGIIPWAEGDLCSVFSVQNARMPLPREADSVVSCRRKQPELLFTPWTASWIKIALAVWSSFKPHCRKDYFWKRRFSSPPTDLKMITSLEEKRTNPTRRWNIPPCPSPHSGKHTKSQVSNAFPWHQARPQHRPADDLGQRTVGINSLCLQQEEAAVGTWMLPPSC